MSTPATQRQWHLLGAERLELREVPVPSPQAGELLVRVDVALTCGTDLKVLRQGGHPRMLAPPCPFGHELAATVVGGAVSGFAIGDRVVVANSAPCGQCLQCRRQRHNLCLDLHYLNGAFGEFLLIPRRFVERSTYAIPAGLSSELAALAEPAACALRCSELLAERIEDWAEEGVPAETLIVGAGALGQLLTGILSLRGARVTCTDPHAERSRLALELGATWSGAPDTLTATPAREGEPSPRGLGSLDTSSLDTSSLDTSSPGVPELGGFDLAIDASGRLDGWRTALAAVRPGGLVVFFGGLAAGSRLELDAHRLHYDEIRIYGVYHHHPASFREALELLCRQQRPWTRLVQERLPLEDLELALAAMRERRILKAALLPGGSDP